MDDWFIIIAVVASLLYEVFRRVFKWRPPVEESKEELNESELDRLFGEPDEAEQGEQDKPPVRPRQEEEKKAPPPLVEEKKAPPPAKPDHSFARREPNAKPAAEPPPFRQPPVRPDATPAQAGAATPNVWEQRLEAARRERERSQPSRQEERLAERFEKATTSGKTPPPVPVMVPAAQRIEGIRAQLSSPQSVRQAIVLREVLAPAPGLEPAGRRFGPNGF